MIKNILKTAIQGLFWLAPIVVVAILILWLYGKISLVITAILSLFGFTPENYKLLWGALVIVLLLLLLFLVGHLVETKLAVWIERLLVKIPGYSTIKDLIGIFNSSKKGEKKVLVVIVKGFAAEGYNIGLMYSQKESIIKQHYTVTLSQTPIPNGGYMFEVHEDNILVIKSATFDNNLEYLLSMGVKSLAEIVGGEPQDVGGFVPLRRFLEGEGVG